MRQGGSHQLSTLWTNLAASPQRAPSPSLEHYSSAPPSLHVMYFVKMSVTSSSFDQSSSLGKTLMATSVLKFQDLIHLVNQKNNTSEKLVNLKKQSFKHITIKDQIKQKNLMSLNKGEHFRPCGPGERSFGTLLSEPGVTSPCLYHTHPRYPPLPPPLKELQNHYSFNKYVKNK